MISEKIIIKIIIIKIIIYDNFLNINNEDQINESTFDTILAHYNYEFFPHNFGKNIIFATLFEYGYLNLVNLYLKNKEYLIKQNKINSCL